jgi:hypothetical protein
LNEILTRQIGRYNEKINIEAGDEML